MNLLTKPILYTVGAIALAALIAVGVQSVRLDREQKAHDKTAEALIDAKVQIEILAKTLNEINAETDRASAEAQRRAEEAEDAAAQARKDAQAYRARLGRIEADIAAGKRNPACRAILEEQTCVRLD